MRPMKPHGNMTHGAPGAQRSGQPTKRAASIKRVLNIRIGLLLSAAVIAATLFIVAAQQQAPMLVEVAAREQVAAVSAFWAKAVFAAIVALMLLLYLGLRFIADRQIFLPLQVVLDRLDRFGDVTGPDANPMIGDALEFIVIDRRIGRIHSLMSHELKALYSQITDSGDRLALTEKILHMEATAKQRAEASLRSSEARFQSLIENSTDATLVISRDGTVRYANPAAAALFGRTPDALTGQPFGFPVGGQEATMLEIFDPQGSFRMAEMRLTTMDWEKEEVTLATLRDVSEQVAAARRLGESENKYRTLFENSKDAIYISDRSGRILDCNKASEEILGHPLKTLKTMSWSDLYADPEDRVFFQFEIETRGAVKNYPLQLVTKEGKVRDCRVTASIILSEQQDVLGYQGIIRDMTELMAYRNNLETMVAERTTQLNRSLAATKAAHQRTNNIIASVADGLIVTDARNRLALLNPAAEALLSVRAAEVIGQPIAAVIKQEDLREHLISCLDTTETDCHRYEFQIPSDQRKHSLCIQALTSSFIDTAGRSSGTVTILSDVTYEQEINRMKTEFISTAAHELRTPLTSICGFSEILLTRSDLKEGEQQRFLQYIFDQGKVLSAIINDLLDLSRIEAGAGFTVNKATHDFADMVRSIAERFQLETGRHMFFLDLPREPLTVCCDRGKMEQVLDNIYSNAVKYSPEGGVIETSLRMDDGWAVISIKDNGLGMTEEQVSRIFEKFYRADASNTAISGTGLGMSIVRHIIETHGGSISVRSQKDKGTTVSIRIPREAPCVSGDAPGHRSCQLQLPLCNTES